MYMVWPVAKPVIGVPRVGVVFKLLTGHIFPTKPSVTQAVLPSGVMAICEGDDIPGTRVPLVGVVLKLLNGQIWPLEKSTAHAVLPSGINATPLSAPIPLKRVPKAGLVKTLVI